MAVTEAAREKKRWRDVFIRALAVMAYFALAINVPVVVKKLINDTNYV